MIKKHFLIALAIIPLNLLGQTAFEQMIDRKGYVEGVTRDWSDSTKINIDEPVMGYINISGNKIPTSKKVTRKAWFEFYDGQGNYFKKRILMSAQGNSSSLATKKKPPTKKVTSLVGTIGNGKLPRPSQAFPLAHKKVTPTTQSV